MILIHGLGAQMYCWRCAVPRLSVKHTCEEHTLNEYIGVFLVLPLWFTLSVLTDICFSLN